MKTNPYTLNFGKIPSQILGRYPGIYNIIEDFESDNPTQTYMLTGIRGSGKTVMLSGLSKHFEKLEDWIVIDLTPDINLIQSFIAELGESADIKKLVKIDGISISLPGLSINVKGTEPITDERVAALKLLEAAKKKNKKVLVTIDEVVTNESIKVFAGLFQVFIRKELPVYLVMTGLYDNINSLQNEKTLTFLYRAPKIELCPLSLSDISENYMKVFSLERAAATEMAKLTNGYPFAFQVLGYLTYDAEGDFDSVKSEYIRYLGGYVYDKLWAELSPKDRLIAGAVAASKDKSVESIKKELDMKQNQFSPYRKRLINKGIITATSHGYVDFTLPFFDRYVLERIEFYS